MSSRFTGARAAAAAQPQGAVAGAAPATALVPKVSRAGPPRRRFISQIPASITEDVELKSAMGALPSNYNFEVCKTIWRLRQMQATAVALQFPEGLLIYACVIADILEVFAGTEVVIMGDVTYGACCVDDLSAAALGVDLLVHYGHSCLVPISAMAVDVMYVFVEIAIDLAHLVDSVRLNFPEGTQSLALCGTIQFGAALHAARAALTPHYAAVRLPQAKPLSAGEVLGCTSPQLGEEETCIFVADGRFHPEAVLIANPTVPLYRYDPYAKAMTRERYEHRKMHALRRAAIQKASGAKRWGVVLGTLGRQGNPDVLRHVQSLLTAHGFPYVTVLLSEVLPAKRTLTLTRTPTPTPTRTPNRYPTPIPTPNLHPNPHPHLSPSPGLPREARLLRARRGVGTGLLPSPLHRLGAPLRRAAAIELRGAGGLGGE